MNTSSAEIESPPKNHLEILFAEAEKMAEFGIWEVNLSDMKLTWTDGVFSIHELDKNEYDPEVETAIEFYVPEHVPVISFCLDKLMEQGKPYDVDLEIITAKKNRIWVRAQGKPVFDENGKIIQIRGIFQNIHTEKLQKVELRGAMHKLATQNERLQQFAHIVSHNLRSHAGNIELMLNMMKEADEDEKSLYLNQLDKIAVSLSDTIQNLQEVVKLDSEDLSPIILKISDAIENTIHNLHGLIKKEKAEIEVLIEDWDDVLFEPAYLDSILFNLISNSLKYRSPDVPLKVQLQTIFRNGKKCLLVRDNGKGIDLDRYGSKVFGMYKTFHGNKDAKGIGLFITKNQVESLGGEISVASTPGQGSEFCVQFAR
ncbi:MAG: PAS domain-containing protein [Bacteroidetes bacterium]|nr:PAS domain-containing protein [Bacteroidota bacterium]